MVEYRDLIDVISEMKPLTEEVDLVRGTIVRMFQVPAVFITPRKDRKPRLVWSNPNPPQDQR